ncbi:MAG TPA: DUF2585 family protein [Kiritimatiellia bacterium]|nr:DUF2585 family protein [Kiritimatiellia bacterium]
MNRLYWCMPSITMMFEAFGRFLMRNRFALVSLLCVCAALAGIELLNGRPTLGPDGRFGWWDGDIWSSENSQRVADTYSFSHIIHGMLFYGFLWLAARQLPLKYRFLIALLIEAGWELLENSPLIINRYRAATIAQGYEGDSVLNSVCDVGMMAVGFLIARLSRMWLVVALIVVMELGCLWWVRDNLTLNVIMLVSPAPAIKAWQSAGQGHVQRSSGECHEQDRTKPAGRSR